MTDPVQPRDSANLEGRHLGPWRIVAELGAGGMGTVYYAEHGVIGRRAAIKVLSNAVSAIPDVVERFFDEARTVNDIRHPNIVDITDFGVSEGQYYLVMELLEGDTLAERLEAGPMSFEKARSVTGQIALALHAAHERGIIHRDLKPENVFLTNHADYPDRVKVLDFGIAKLLGEGGEASRKTQTGVIMGTPAYMSPEQCVGDTHLDRRSDVYSLGIVAFEMLAGRTPFEAENFGRYVLAHVHEEPPRIDSLVDVSADVADVLAKALAKKPEDRHQTAEELRLALDAAIQGRSTVEVRRTEREERNEEEARTQRVGDKLEEIIQQRIVEGRLTLPSMPMVAQNCLRLLDREDFTFPMIAKELERDPLLASQLLRIVNSPIYGGRGRIESMSQAASRLGMKPLRMLLTQMSVRAVFQSKEPRIEQSFRAIWEHCLAVGIISRELAGALEGAPPKDAVYLAGLLHDVGKPVVGAMLLEVERQLMPDLGEPWMTDALWYRIVDNCHQGVGRVLADRWGLPELVRDGISKFHAYELGGASSVSNLLRYGNALARREGVDLGTIDAEQTLKVIEQGRELLGTDDALEAEITADLRSSVMSLTGEQPRTSKMPPALRQKTASGKRRR